MSMFGTALAGVGSIVDIVGNALANRRREALGREGNQQIQDFINGLSPGGWKALTGASNTDWTLDGKTFGTGDSGRNFNLDDYFAPSASVRDAWSENYGGGYDFGGLTQRANTPLAWQIMDPKEAASDVGSFLPTQSTSDYLASQLDTIGRGSQSSYQNAMNAYASAGAQSGRSLDELGGGQALLGFQNQANAASQAQQARAGTEAMRNDLLKTRAGLESSAYMGQRGINAQLAGQQSSNIADLGSKEANAYMEAAKAATGATESDISNQAAGKTNAFNAFRQFQGDDQAIANLIMQMRQAGTSQGAGILAGIPVTYNPITSGLNQGYSNDVQASMKPKSSSGFGATLFGTGGSFNSGCIDADSVVTTKERGEVTIRDIRPGDAVKGSDGEFHRVIAKDCGSDDRGQGMIRIEVGPNVIVATPDHNIDMRPAGAWREHEMIEMVGGIDCIDSVTHVAYRECGDIMLDGTPDYVANGFNVRSQIGRHGIDVYRRTIEMNPELGGSKHENGIVRAVDNPDGVWAITEE